MTTTTAARPQSIEGSHWYYPDGKPCHEVQRASGDGMRPTTISDARKLGLLPSVTTILKVLNKPGLNNWLIEQACLAVLTTPHPREETLDTFVHRVLQTERVQDQESSIARDRGSEIHQGISDYFQGRDPDESVREWIGNVVVNLESVGVIKGSEVVLVSKSGYAGTCDLIQETKRGLVIWDFKTTKKLPSHAWPEHELQCSAYAKALAELHPGVNIDTGNIYISTVEPGQCVVHEHEVAWATTWADGFFPLLQHWKWANSF